MSTARSKKGTETQPAPLRIRVQALGRADWDLVECLFGKNGACGGCWCMYWRLPQGGRLWQENKGEPNRRAFRKLVKAGTVTGCLALAGEEPVGWCCLGPRAEFPRLERVRALAHPWAPGTWAVVCFYVPARWRGKGVATRLLREAVRLARQGGARVLEGYPVGGRGPGAKPVPAAFAWTGVPELFRAAGFRKVSGPQAPRDVYRITFRPRRGC